jgi:quercetin 2,3-dioxygenase
MRKIKQLHQAVYAPIDDLITYRAMPTNSIEHLDPFLFLNHHGPQEYGPNNHGLPFGPHPHRGFETLTYILQGDIAHLDSASGESVIEAGGIQWMTAGSGLVHAEVSSEEFKRKGGMEEVIQIWLNLPSYLKLVEPNYTGLQKEDVPALSLDDGRVTVHLISGEWGAAQGPINSLTGIHNCHIELAEDGKFSHRSGSGTQHPLLRDQRQSAGEWHRSCPAHSGRVANEGDALKVEALSEAAIIFGHGEPYGERIVAHGPFVMNTEGEIRQAMLDYQSGKLGR